MSASDFRYDFVIASLKRVYFAVAQEERYPLTPETTRYLDRLQLSIRTLQAEAKAKQMGATCG